MAWSPSESNETPAANSDVERNNAATMVMRNPDAATANVGDRATQICEVVAALPPGAADDVEPSIEEYMQALLQRARQGQGSSAERTIPLPAVIRTPRAPEPVVAEPVPAVTDVTATPSMPASPPECRTAISEMRNLANISTRTTFHSQLGFRLVREMRWNGFVAVGAMATSGILLGLAPSARSPIFFAAVTAAVVAAVWILKFFDAGRLLRCVNAEAALDASTGSD